MLPPVAMFIYEDFIENWSAKILLGTKMSLKLWIEYLALNTFFIFVFYFLLEMNNFRLKETDLRNGTLN